ncbi:uncharacterized protein [Haliotis asinina]|uniref:uncharacterized protein n=1 Tax=Haliotis asinina TaxID=109174 RepID=UPI003531AF32
MIQTEAFPLGKTLESMHSCIESWPGQILFPCSLFSTQGTDRFVKTKPVLEEGYLSLDIKSLSTFLSKIKQVCLVFDKIDKNTDIITIREYLESVLGSNVIDIYHSFDDSKTEIENIDECISTSEYFIFIPTRGKKSYILKYALNLIVSELSNSSGQNNILNLTDSKENAGKIPPLLRPFPIVVCNFDQNWCLCASPVLNENHPQINTNVKLSHFANRIGSKFKPSKSVRIISDDIEEGELIKKSILSQCPTTKVTVNDDDVPCGALLFYEYAMKLCEDQLFVIVPSRERSCESEYALRVIFSRINKEPDILRIQCAETITSIDCCTKSYIR